MKNQEYSVILTHKKPTNQLHGTPAKQAKNQPTHPINHKQGMIFHAHDMFDV